MSFIRPGWADAFETMAYRNAAVNLGDSTGLKAALAAATAHPRIKAVRLSEGVYDDPAAFESAIGNEDITIIPTPGALIAPPEYYEAAIAGGVPAGINFKWIDRASIDRVSFARYGPTRVITPEWAGAYGTGEDDDLDVCQWAVDRGAVARMEIEMPRRYGLTSKLVFPATNGYSFKMHPSTMVAAEVPDMGFVWIGPAGTAEAPQTVIEFNEADNVNFEAIWVHNRSAFYQPYVRAFVWRNPEDPGEGSAPLGANNRFKRIGATGTWIGLNIGDHTYDGYDSNIEAHRIDEVLLYDVDHCMLVDSRGIDNIDIHGFRALGHPSVRTRDYIIERRRNGGYFKIHRAWIGMANITPNVAGIKNTGNFGSPINFGSVEFENAEVTGEVGYIPCRAMDVVDSGGRAKTLVTSMSMPEGMCIDDDGYTMKLNVKPSIQLQNVAVSGNILVEGGLVIANDVTFFEGNDFEITGGKVVRPSVSHREIGGSLTTPSSESESTRYTLLGTTGDAINSLHGTRNVTADMLHNTDYRVLTIALGTNDVVGLAISFMVWRGGVTTRNFARRGQIIITAVRDDAANIQADDPEIVWSKAAQIGGTLGVDDPAVTVSKVVDGTNIQIWMKQTNGNSDDARVTFVVDLMTQGVLDTSTITIP